MEHTENKKQNSLALIISIITLIIVVIGIILILTNKNIGNNNNKVTTAEDFLLEAAKDLGLKNRAFNNCIKSEDIEMEVNDDINEVISIGGNGAPFSVIVNTDGTLIPVSGALPYEVFTRVLELTKTNSYDDIENLLKEIYGGEYSGVIKDGIKIIRQFDPEFDHYKGDINAEITLIEYSDYQCPFCSRVHTTLKKVVEEYSNVKLVYRHFPLESIHDQAKPAAIVSECIAKEKGNDAFWEFTDLIFKDQTVLE